MAVAESFKATQAHPWEESAGQSESAPGQSWTARPAAGASSCTSPLCWGANSGARWAGPPARSWRPATLGRETRPAASAAGRLSPLPAAKENPITGRSLLCSARSQLVGTAGSCCACLGRKSWMLAVAGLASTSSYKSVWTWHKTGSFGNRCQ